MIINRLYENQNLLSLYLVSFLVGLRTYQHPRKKSISLTHRYVLRRYGFPGTRRRQMVHDIKGLNHWLV